MPQNPIYERPNLYRFATKELDQDATLAYLLDWARPEIRDNAAPDSDDGRLNRLGEELLWDLVRCHPSRAAWQAEEIEKLVVRTQRRHVDVCAEIETSRAKYFLIVEDKIGAKERKGQIRDYFNWAQEEYSGWKIVPVYVKTGNESWNHVTYKDLSVPECGIFRREHLLRLLDAHPQTGNRIVEEFRAYWQAFDKETRSYAETPPSEWKWRQCEGYYADLERGLEAEGVHAWWHSDTIARVGTFLHLFCDEVGRPSDGMNVRIQVRCDGNGLHELGVQAIRDGAKHGAETDSATLHRLFREYTRNVDLLGSDAHLDKSGRFRPGVWPKLSTVRFDGGDGRDGGSYLALDSDGLVDLKRTADHIVRVRRFLVEATKRIERVHRLMKEVAANIAQAKNGGRLSGWESDLDGDPINRIRLHRTDHWTQKRNNGIWLNLWEPSVLLGVEWPRGTNTPRTDLKAWFAEALDLAPESKRGGNRGRWTTYWPVEVCRIREIGEWDDGERERFASEQAERLIALAAVIDRAEGRIS